MIKKYAKITIERDKYIENFVTDKFDPNTETKTYWVSAIGYGFRYEDGRIMFVHPSTTVRIIIDEVQVDE